MLSVRYRIAPHSKITTDLLTIPNPWVDEYTPVTNKV